MLSQAPWQCREQHVPRGRERGFKEVKPKLVMWVQRRGTLDWCMSSDPLSCAQHLPSPRIYLQINEGIGGQKKMTAKQGGRSWRASGDHQISLTNFAKKNCNFS